MTEGTVALHSTQHTMLCCLELRNEAFKVITHAKGRDIMYNGSCLPYNSKVMRILCPLLYRNIPCGTI